MVNPVQGKIPHQMTGGGGYQFFLRCPDPGKNKRLAWHPNPFKDDKKEIVIETRAEGGYALIPPSLRIDGEKKTNYAWIFGDLFSVPTYSQKVAENLLEAARACSRVEDKPALQNPETKPKQQTGGESPGSEVDVIQEYKRQNRIRDTLLRYGYTETRDSRFIRPGGKSASVRIYPSENRSTHFSSSDPMFGDAGHDPFDLYCYYEHNGDFKKAVKQAARDMGIQYKSNSNVVQMSVVKGQKEEKEKEKAPKEPKSKRPPKTPTAFIQLMYDLTEEGNAMRVFHRFGREIMYYPQVGWYGWSGKIWEQNDHVVARKYWRMVEQDIVPMYERETDDEVAEVMASFVVSSKRNNSRTAALAIVADIEEVQTHPDEHDFLKEKINLQNGVFDLRAGTLEDHNPDYKQTKIANVEAKIPSDVMDDEVLFDEHLDAKCPLWLEFIDTIFGNNHELISFIQECVGYSFTGSCIEHSMFLLYGGGKNGKSTFLNVLLKILGNYGTTLAIESLLTKNVSTIPNDIAKLPSVRFVSSVEPNKGVWLDEAKIKALTGGDTIQARFMRKEWFEFIPHFKLWIACNHLPRISGGDLGIWRRVFTIPFTVTIPQEKMDLHMETKLLAEKEGILAWAVAGARRWMAKSTKGKGLVPPAVVEAANLAYQMSSDILAIFLEEKCMTFLEDPDKSESTNYQTPVATLYHEFKLWLLENGEVSRTSRWFSDKLKDKGFSQTNPRKDYKLGKSVRYWKGVLLLQDVPVVDMFVVSEE